MAYKPTAPHPLTALGCLYRFPPTLLPSNTGEVGIRTGYRLATSMTALDDPAPSCHLDMAELEDARSSPFQYRCFMVLSSVFSFSLRRIPFHGHCDGVWRASATEGARRIWFVMDRGPLRSGSIDFYSSQTQHRCRTKISLWPGSCLLAVTVLLVGRPALVSGRSWIVRLLFPVDQVVSGALVAWQGGIRNGKEGTKAYSSCGEYRRGSWPLVGKGRPTGELTGRACTYPHGCCCWNTIHVCTV